MGDLNDLQQYALIYYLAETDKKSDELLWQQFKLETIAGLATISPELAKAIMDLDRDSASGEEGYAAPLSDEEMEEYVPLSGEEIDQTLDLFEGFGLKM